MNKESIKYIPFPKKKYNIIYADPGWQYRDKALAGNRGSCCKYRTEGTEYLMSLPVKDIAADDCVLFMWVTMPKLFDGPKEVIEAWGFKYKTCAFTWVKKNKKADSWFWGMGNWTRANSELCLLAIRGKPKRISAKVHSVIDAPIKKHSEKPDEARNRIIQLCGDLPRIELFARENIDGWDNWGDELY